MAFTTCAVTQIRRPSFAPHPSRVGNCCVGRRGSRATIAGHSSLSPHLSRPPVRELRYVPTLFVSMDAAKAHQHGQVLGLGGYCHGLFFSLPLAPQSRHANSIATLELMALLAAVATFHTFFRHFPRVVLESDSLS
eukprot:5610875-Pleurochrysis_carterae.AAC.1